MWDFPDDPAVQKVALEMHEARSPVGAVCHGPSALVDVKLSDGTFLIAGKEVAAFTNCEEEKMGLAKVVPYLFESKLLERGVKHIAALDFQKNVVASTRLVTCQHRALASGVAEKMLELMRGK